MRKHCSAVAAKEFAIVELAKVSEVGVAVVEDAA